MDIFRTIVEPEPPGFQLEYRDAMFLAGSCFTTSIGNRLEALKFSTCNNPFGVLYNPSSIAQNLERLNSGIAFGEENLQQFNDLWLSLSHHGSFSNPDKMQCLEKINASFNSASAFLKNSTCLIITFGTAWVYRYRETGQIVANCHKINQNEFERFMLNPQEIATQYIKLIQNLRSKNPALKLVFTVSPVRHLKDGMAGNQLSKSVLLLAIQLIREKLDTCDYFPAFEIMMDDLRDYRYYEPDMIHPSNQAVDYIWKQFSKKYFNEATRDLIAAVEKINSAMNHRPLHPGSVEYAKFCQSQLKGILNIKAAYPFLDLEKEEAHFRSHDNAGNKLNLSSLD
jgi:hypothetical protein